MIFIRRDTHTFLLELKLFAETAMQCFFSPGFFMGDSKADLGNIMVIVASSEELR